MRHGGHHPQSPPIGRAVMSAVLLFTCLVEAVRAEVPVPQPVAPALVPLVFVAPAPAPPIFVKLPWIYNTSTASGYWFTADQVVRLNAQMDYLADRAAQECFDNAVKADQAFLSSKPGLIVGAAAVLVVGAVAGAFIHQRLTH